MQPRIVRERRSLLQQAGGLFHFRLVLDVVRHGTQRALRVATQHRVLAARTGQVGALELLLGHVERIELGARGLRTDARHERRVVGETVPRAVVDRRETLRVRVAGQALEQRVAVAVGLLPEQAVHDVRSVDEQAEHAALVVA